MSSKNSVDVLIVNTPTEACGTKVRNIHIPMAPIFLSAYIKQYGFSTAVLDLNAMQHGEKAIFTSREECIAHALERIEVLRPTLIGLTCLFSLNLASMVALAEACKKQFPHIPIVAGGMHPTLFARELLEHYTCLDAIVLGEGEETLLHLARHYCQELALPEHIDGVAVRKHGEIFFRPKTSYFENIDVLPQPDYASLDMSLYETTDGWYNPRQLPVCTPVSILTSRSCPNKCNFCAMNKTMGTKFRARTSLSVVDEMQFLYETYGTTYFIIEDDNFTLNKKRTLEICDLISTRNMRIQMDTRNGLMVSTLDDEIIDSLADVGLVRTFLAIESGSKYIRNFVIGKRIDDEKIYNVVESFKKYSHIFVFAFFMLGFPEETNESLQDTHTMLKRLDVDGFNMNFVTPYPGTRLFEQCVRDNILINIDADKVWNSTDLWHNGSQNIFIKPYSISIECLLHWHEIFTEIYHEKVRSSIAKGKALKSFRG